MFGWKNILPQMNSSKWVKYIDKIQFKEYCKNKNINTIETISVHDTALGVCKTFDSLPNQFVIKLNTGVGMNLMVDDKRKWTRQTLLNKLSNFKQHWYNNPWEPQYMHIEPKFMVEHLIIPTPRDYKVFVLNKKPVFLLIVDDRFNKKKHTTFKVNKDLSLTKFDCRWNIDSVQSEKLTTKTSMKILKSAIVLAKDVDLELVRIDLYVINGKIYGGEVTLTSGGFINDINKDCADLVVSPCN